MVQNNFCSTCTICDMGQPPHPSGQVTFACHLPRDKFCKKYLSDPVYPPWKGEAQDVLVRWKNSSLDESVSYNFIPTKLILTFVILVLFFTIRNGPFYWTNLLGVILVFFWLFCLFSGNLAT